MVTISGGKTFLQTVASRLYRYPVGQKFRQNSSFSLSGFLRLRQKFKMATKNGGKRFLQKVASRLRRHPVGQHFVEITLSCSVIERNAFLHLTQKFKMAAKSGGKMIFVKSRQ